MKEWIWSILNTIQIGEKRNKENNLRYPRLRADERFPEFVESIIPILENNNDIEVAIAGQDKIIYGGVRPKEGTFGYGPKTIKEVYR